jgi:hypothetical protein
MSNLNSFAKSIDVDFSASNDTVSTVDASNYSSTSAKNESKPSLQAQLDHVRSNSSENTATEPKQEDFALWASSEHDQIHPKHRKEWMEGSGISKEITEACLESLDDDAEIAKRLGWKGYDRSHGWWVGSISIVTGERTATGQFKPDVPFLISDKSDKPAKYITTKTEIDVLALSIRSQEEWQVILDDPSQPIVITEGAKKVAALETCGYVALGALGVWNFLQKNDMLVPNLQAITQPGRPVVIAYDADLITKQGVRDAMKRLADCLKAQGCSIYIAQWDVEEGKGLDDVLVTRGKHACTALPLKLYTQ